MVDFKIDEEGGGKAFLNEIRKKYESFLGRNEIL